MLSCFLSAEGRAFGRSVGVTADGAGALLMANGAGNMVGHSMPLAEVNIIGAENPDQSDDDQVHRDDVIQQPRHDQDKNAGDQ